MLPDPLHLHSISINARLAEDVHNSTFRAGKPGSTLANPVSDPRPRILLLEPSPVLRHSVQEILATAGYQAVACESVEELVMCAREGPVQLALAAWLSLEGLMTDDRLHDLAAVSRRLRLVPMVPRGWLTVVRPAELGVAGVLARPVERDELLAFLSAERERATLVGHIVQQHVVA
jgi:DNA-binding response OmpR family regulator